MPLSHCDTWIVDRQWAYSVQRVPDCLGGLSRVGISTRSTRPWNGQPPSCYYERLEVEKLLIDYDIICLQETWLSKQQEGDLKCMNKKCNAVANSPNDDSQGITVGRKKEGVAILWNSQLDTYI